MESDGSRAKVELREWHECAPGVHVHTFGVDVFVFRVPLLLRAGGAAWPSASQGVGSWGESQRIGRTNRERERQGERMMYPREEIEMSTAKEWAERANGASTRMTRWKLRATTSAQP